MHFAASSEGSDLTKGPYSTPLTTKCQVGGARSPVGPIIGSLIFFLTPELIRLDPITTQIVYGVVLILIVLVSPQGLAPGFAYLTGRIYRLANRRPLSGGTTP